MRPGIVVASCALALVLHSHLAAACDEELDDPDVCAEEVAAFDESFQEDESFFERLELEIGNRMMHGLVIRRLDTFVVEFEEENDLETDPDFDPDIDDLPDDTDTEQEEESAT